MARIPGCANECKESNTLRRRCVGIHGRGFPVDISHIMVVDQPGNGNGLNWSEGGGDFRSVSCSCAVDSSSKFSAGETVMEVISPRDRVSATLL